MEQHGRLCFFGRDIDVGGGVLCEQTVTASFIQNPTEQKMDTPDASGTQSLIRELFVEALDILL